MTTFKKLGILSPALAGIQELGFEYPMPIQEEVIPVLLETDDDLIGLAQTGTGKTAAYGLPLVQRTDAKDRRTQVLILAPTRELCLQISRDMRCFAKHFEGIQVVTVYGGADMYRQIKALQKGAHIIVATPGRMNDLLNRRKKIDLSTLKTLVLDEADEMLNMGFKEELDEILEQTPEEKRTLLFSATMPREVLQISKRYMENPREITIGIKNAGAENVQHLCYVIREKDRYPALKRIADYNPNIYGIIFCRTRMETKEIAEKLIRDGYNADALHGELSQAQREHTMHKFKIRNLQMLVATDVAARGLDIKDLTHIINYTLPDDDDIYTHRSGRTGRAGKTGISIALINLKEKYKIKKIERKLKKTFEQVLVPSGKEICEKQLLTLVDKMQTIEVDHKTIDKFLPVVYEKLEWLSREQLIKNIVSLEFNRFLDYYRDHKDLNLPKEREEKSWRRGGKAGKPGKPGKFGKFGKRRDSNFPEVGYARFFINLGFRDSVSPRELIGLINRCTRNRNIEIGKIDLGKSFSFFEVDEHYTSLILEGFEGIDYNHRELVVEVANEEQSSEKRFRKKYAKHKKFKGKR